MRLFKLCFIPVLLATGPIASGQGPSAMKLQGRARISGEWASAPTAPGAIVVPTAGVEAAPMPGPATVAPVPGAAIGAPVPGPVYGTAMGQCGAGGCGATCDSCGREGCLARLGAWFCSRPLHACDKQVCYSPVPPLYQFFPCPREGYCPRLAPPACCPAPVQVLHPICSTRRPWANTYCGSCGVACGAGGCGKASWSFGPSRGAGACGSASSGAGACGSASCGDGSCGGCSSCGTCSSCEGDRGSWLRFFRPLRCGGCCTPSAQCFTAGQVTGGCADGGCGPK